MEQNTLVLDFDFVDSVDNEKSSLNVFKDDFYLSILLKILIYEIITRRLGYFVSEMKMSLTLDN